MKMLQRAWELLDQGEYEKGLAVYLSLPQSEQRCNGLVRCLTETGRFGEAKKVLNSGLKKYPNSDSLWVAMGNLHLTLENYSEALKCFHRAILLSPDHNSTALFSASVGFKKLNRFQQAILILDSLIRKHPEDALFLVERGHCAIEMGNPQEALVFYLRAKSIWRNSGNFQEALALFSGLTTVYIDLQMNKEALKIAVEGLKKLDGGHPILFYNLGRALCGMNMIEEARETLREGLRKFPNNADLLELIQEIEDDMDSPSPQGGTEIIFALILLALIARRKHPRK
jgi:tetratricopeptide (TPR) repeat protein